MARPRNDAAWGSVVVGAASVAALPVAIYLTRFSDRYELLHTGFVIPVAAVLGLVAIVLAGRARRRIVVMLGRAGGDGLVRAGRILGIIGVCMALAALVALGVYGLLEYVGNRD